MQASKVRISPQTINNSFLSPQKKAALKRERIIEYIRSKPVGTTMSVQEIGQAAGYKPSQSGAAWQFLNAMVKDGVLGKEHLVGTHKNRWTVLIDAKTVVPKPSSNESPTGGGLTDLGRQAIANLAKDFYWETSSNSLKEFVEWVGDKK